MPVQMQVIQIFSATNGYVYDYPLTSIGRYMTELSLFLESRKSELLKTLSQKKTLDDDLKKKITEALDEFKKIFVA